MKQQEHTYYYPKSKENRRKIQNLAGSLAGGYSAFKNKQSIEDPRVFFTEKERETSIGSEAALLSSIGAGKKAMMGQTTSLTQEICTFPKPQYKQIKML